MKFQYPFLSLNIFVIFVHHKYINLVFNKLWKKDLHKFYRSSILTDINKVACSPITEHQGNCLGITLYTIDYSAYFPLLGIEKKLILIV